jgi:type I restriction enzyme S subunit
MLKEHITWQTKKLGEVCDIITRGISPKYIESDGICVLNQKCIRDHKINYELSRLHDNKAKRVNNEKIIQLGDVLVNSTGTGTLGRVAQVREISTIATVDSHITIVRPKKGLFYNDFFGYALIFIEDEIAKKGEGCGGQTELARSTLKNDFVIKYPASLQDQQRIVFELDTLLTQAKKLISIYQKKLINLEELKKSILQNTFNGELSKLPSLIETNI